MCPSVFPLTRGPNTRPLQPICLEVRAPVCPVRVCDADPRALHDVKLEVAPPVTCPQHVSQPHLPPPLPPPATRLASNSCHQLKAPPHPHRHRRPHPAQRAYAAESFARVALVPIPPSPSSLPLPLPPTPPAPPPPPPAAGPSPEAAGGSHPAAAARRVEPSPCTPGNKPWRDGAEGLPRQLRLYPLCCPSLSPCSQVPARPPPHEPSLQQPISHAVFSCPALQGPLFPAPTSPRGTAPPPPSAAAPAAAPRRAPTCSKRWRRRPRGRRPPAPAAPAAAPGSAVWPGRPSWPDARRRRWPVCVWEGGE